ncbi:hypothetical protein BGX38DRAFT_280535 [Terfezia claveryi]|nr:hypothetical protein BGX38DRAFT_280535 [Terfezia claveryi]
MGGYAAPIGSKERAAVKTSGRGRKVGGGSLQGEVEREGSGDHGHYRAGGGDVLLVEQYRKYRERTSHC